MAFNSSAALEALRITCHVNSKYVIEYTLPSLIDRLPETSTDCNPMIYLHVLHTLRVLSPAANVYQHAMPLLIEKFDTVCTKGTF